MKKRMLLVVAEFAAMSGISFLTGCAFLGIMPEPLERLPWPVALLIGAVAMAIVIVDLRSKPVQGVAEQTLSEINNNGWKSVRF